MIHDDALLRALNELDQPAAPSPAFADRLLEQVRMEAGLPSATTEVSANPVLPAPTHVAHQKEHERWSGLAGVAAAVLLFAIIGTLWSLSRENGPERAAPIVAETLPYSGDGADQPVMQGGSAANDGQYPGPAPRIGSYEQLWTVNVPSVSFAALYGTHLYYALDSEQLTGSGQIVALDSATGTEVWRRAVSARFAFSIIPGGVVVGLPAPSNEGANLQPSSIPDGVRVALLSHQTGEIVWQSERIYRLPNASFVVSRIASATILFGDEDAAAIAIDAANGVERWRYVSPVAGDCAIGDCSSSVIVTTGDMVYFPDLRVGTLTALSLDDGRLRWTTALPLAQTNKSPQDPPRFLTLFAVDQGVIMSSFDPSGDSSGHLALHMRQNGATAWQRDFAPPMMSLLRIGTSFYVMTRDTSDSQGRAAFLEVDIASGQTVRSIPGSDPNVLSNAVYLPAADVVVGGFRTGYHNRSWVEQNIPVVGALFGGDAITSALTLLDPVTFETIGKPAMEDCIIDLPLAPDGKVLCRKGTELSVYAPEL